MYKWYYIIERVLSMVLLLVGLMGWTLWKKGCYNERITFYVGYLLSLGTSQCTDKMGKYQLYINTSISYE